MLLTIPRTFHTNRNYLRQIKQKNLGNPTQNPFKVTSSNNNFQVKKNVSSAKPNEMGAFKLVCIMKTFLCTMESLFFIKRAKSAPKEEENSVFQFKVKFN